MPPLLLQQITFRLAHRQEEVAMAVEPREIQEQRVRHRHTQKSSPTPPPLRRQVGMSKT